MKGRTRLADKLARDHVLARDYHRCLYCGKDGRAAQLEWAHIITRGAPYIRWEPDNAVTLCRRDHAEFTAKPEAFKRWIADLYGPDHRDKLMTLEAFFERQGGSVDVEAVIRGFRERELTPAEMTRYREGQW